MKIFPTQPDITPCVDRVSLKLGNDASAEKNRLMAFTRREKCSIYFAVSPYKTMSVTSRHTDSGRRLIPRLPIASRSKKSKINDDGTKIFSKNILKIVFYFIFLKYFLEVFLLCISKKKLLSTIVF